MGGKSAQTRQSQFTLPTCSIMVYIILDRSIYTRCGTDTDANNLTKIGKEKYAAVVNWWDEKMKHTFITPHV